MNIQKAKYSKVLESVKAVGECTAGDIKNACIALLIASLFKYDKLDKNQFDNKNVNLELLNPVRELIKKVNELHPINVDAVLQNAAALIIKTARSTFGCPHAIAYGYSEFASTLVDELKPSHILSNTALINATKYTDELIGAMETNDNILVSNEGCNCVAVSY